MQKIDTYMICNSALITKLKTVKGFSLNLGQALINNSKFMPKDVKIQKHYLYYNEIINLIGYIGTLSIYTQTQCKHNTLILYNEKEVFQYTLDNYLSVYDNINTSIDLFFTKIGLKKDISTIVEEEIQIVKPEYVKPDKLMSEMNEEERIMFARNFK
jgi:hypothetical protein